MRLINAVKIITEHYALSRKAARQQRSRGLLVARMHSAAELLPLLKHTVAAVIGVDQKNKNGPDG